MSIFSNVSKNFRSNVDKTIAGRKEESAARKKLSDLEFDKEVSSGAASYKKKGLSDEDARVLAKSDVKKKRTSEKWGKVTGALSEVGSNMGSNFGSSGGFGSSAGPGMGDDMGWVNNVANSTRKSSTRTRKTTTNKASPKKPAKKTAKKRTVVRRRTTQSEPDFNTAMY
ncbi:hypothetical protein [uncultured Methanomethylovorans sp.]|uniref:hypothetical protein n=1 Tax=uncultured Methanomethylovorans sp. TaxID=183759 RepID=UPI002AA5E453|nr:hypothetical protein [uncultured Methanomethylovorans sp.]